MKRAASFGDDAAVVAPKLDDEELERLAKAMAQMPRDVWQQVLMKLSIRDVGRMRRVSQWFNARFFHPASPDSNIWDTLLEREAPRETFEFLKLAFPKEADADNVFLRLAAFRASTRPTEVGSETTLIWQWNFKRGNVDGPLPIYRLSDIYTLFVFNIERDDIAQETKNFQKINDEISYALLRLRIFYQGRWSNSSGFTTVLQINDEDRERVRLIFLGAMLRVLLPMSASLEEPLNIGIPIRACAIATCTKSARYTCGGCNSVAYCSAQCQAHDWQENAHSTFCLVEAGKRGRDDDSTIVESSKAPRTTEEMALLQGHDIPMTQRLYDSIHNQAHLKNMAESTSAERLFWIYHQYTPGGYYAAINQNTAFWRHVLRARVIAGAEDARLPALTELLIARFRHSPQVLRAILNGASAVMDNDNVRQAVNQGLFLATRQ